ncbi:BRCA1-associated protein 2-domain-containing protein [Linnemannia elongata]|nr:BRCA1-associated protein 2-domain-containing protein [Linnemannia elongata]
MNSYHLKLDLYPSPPSPQPDQPPSRSTTTAALTSSKTPPSKAQQQGHGPAQELTARFQTLFKPFPQQTHHQQQLPPQSTPSITSSSSAQKRNNKQEASTGSTISHPQDDYRFGHISVSSLDQSTSTTATVVKEKSGSISATTATANNSNNKGRSTKNKKMTPSTTTAGAATTATVISDARSTGFKDSEPAQGILRLYRDTNEITTGQITTTTKQEASATTTTTSYSAALSAGTTAASAQPVLATTADAGTHEHGTQIIQPDQGTSVCVLAVPSYLSPGDFLNFVGPVRSNVSHFRIIRDSVPNRFMVLMKFRTKEATAEFYKRYNGKAFSSLEPEICHVVYLKSIEIRAGSMPPYAFPFLNDDPFLQSHHHSSSTPAEATQPEVGEGSPHHQEHGSNNHLSMSSLHSDHGLAELPTCPVCLERMDSSVTGLLTILCQHTFHCHCLSKWGEGSCPVCRYSQKTITTKSSNTTATGTGLSATTDGVSEDQNVCAICGTTENLWICLICGHIGCGRYQEKHAYHHYYETSHLYALELESQRVWDYAGDGYVHRLIQNKTDGKLVELPSAVDGTLPSQHSVQVGQEKLDAIGLEYTYLLTSQLESQRLYFDAQMAAMTAQLAQLGKEAKDWEQEAALMNQKNRELAILAESLEKEKLPMLVKEKKAAEKRMEKMQERLQALERQYEEEKEMNVGLMTNQESIRTKLQEKEAEILELQDQVRDMMIYLDTQQKIESSSLKDELANGTVGVVVQPPQTSSPSGNHSRRKGRK